MVGLMLFQINFLREVRQRSFQETKDETLQHKQRQFKKSYTLDHSL